MRQSSPDRFLGMVVSAVIILAHAACNGGGNGGGSTTSTPPTPPGSTVTIDLATLPSADWAVLKPQGRVIKATMGAAPIVDFELKDKVGNGLTGLAGFTSQSATALRPSYPNLTFAIAKLIPEDAVTKAPSKWVSYIVTSMPTTTTATAPSRPTTDNTGTLVDNGDGTYRYTFYRDITATQAFLNNYTFTGNNLKADLGDVTYEPSRTHRISIQFYGNARGTGSNTPTGATVATAVPLNEPINLIYDFVPSTGLPVSASNVQREITSTSRCNECHEKIGTTTPHSGRVDTRYCVVCHTDQRKYGYAEASTTATGYNPTESLGGTATGQRRINSAAVGEMTAMVHRIHMGKELTKDGYNYADILFETKGYSILDGGQRICGKCHSGSDAKATAQGENWSLKPSRLACGACHDNVDFATGTIGGVAAAHVVQTSDVACAGCHVSGSDPAIDIKISHRTLNVTAHNPTIQTGLANFTYEIASATQAVAGGDVIINFRILRSIDGSVPTPVTFVAPGASVSNPLTGFTGSPAFLLAWASTQDGVTTPVDYNNLGSGSTNFQPRSISIANLLSTGLARGSLTGPDANGYYTATITSSTYTFPVDTTMRTVALQSYFTQVTPAAARHAAAVSMTVTGDTVRRKVIDNNKCSNCHEWFEGHGGQRVYHVQVCVMCHVPGLATSGRGMTDAALSLYYTPTPPATSPTFTAKEKTTLTGWTGISFATNPVTAGNTNVALNFPQVTNNMKDMIHGLHAGKTRTDSFKIVRNRTPSAVNIVNGGEIGFPGILKNCQSCHTSTGFTGLPANILASRYEAKDPGVTDTTAKANTALANLNATDLVTTPFTAACISCHDSSTATAHVQALGGQILVPRSTLNLAGETCVGCHAPGRPAGIAELHQ